jgi:UDP-GlcNAc3NAcA epimerase
MKVVTIVGARPQFIKAAPVGAALRMHAQEILVHTGQHYDRDMSDLFFEELHIPRPDYELGIGSGLHGWQTGQMLMRCEEVLIVEKPDWVLVYGDTNSTLAGALAAVKLQIPVAHVEAGLRSFNRLMPEEHNRILTDHCADLLLCPTRTAVARLSAEGITQGVYFVGDVMFDAALEHGAVARQRSTLRRELKLENQAFALATIHRPYNTDDADRLHEVLAALESLEQPIVFPMHPRTQAALDRCDLHLPTNIIKINPIGYLDMLALEQAAQLIITDSGGVQKEAYFFGIPCVTLRPETEWIETVETGWNRLAWGDALNVWDAIHRPWPTMPPPKIFGDGHASMRIVQLLNETAITGR